ncbi:hypothetical protein GCM10017673_06530 [Streptosporangium violaceochromogenes]|nr:hypothetical protein GCM10017673_06530 [Streptosporangium violaceochromogenes]
MNGVTVLTAAAAGCLLGALGTRTLGRLALRWDFTDRPGGHKVHARPVPYFGGVAIMLGTIVPSLGLLGLADEHVTAIMVAAGAVSLLGLVDDIAPLSPLTRLAVEAVTAGGVVLSGVQASVTGTWLDAPITLVWIVVITNSFNLLDNMDGALGSVTAVSAAFLAGTAFVYDRPATGLLLIALAHACLGFLLYNWAPAKVFMGDAGSLFIGFVLACSAALLVTGRDPDTAIAGLVLPTFVATADTVVVLVSRRRGGRPLFQGGTDHISHRLRALGLGTRRTVALITAAAAVTGALGLTTALGWTSPLIATLAAAGAAIVLADLPQRVRGRSQERLEDSLTIIHGRRR